MRAPWAVVPFLLLACGDGAPAGQADGGPGDGSLTPEAGGDLATGVPDDVAASSGTRLRARFYVTEGDRLFAGWYDQARGEVCHFRAGADGTTRCFPEVFHAYAGAHCGGRDLVLIDRQDSCERPKRLVDNELGGVDEIEPQAIAAIPSGCSLALGERDELHFVARRIPDTAFVAAHRVRATTVPGVRLTPILLVADDGAAEPTSHYDEELGVECDVAIADDGQRRCLPALDPCFSAVAYADAACTAAFANDIVSPTCPPSPRFARGWMVLVAQDCPDDRSTVFAPGPPPTAHGGGWIYKHDPQGACVTAGQWGGITRGLTPVEPSRFAAVPAPPSARVRRPFGGLAVRGGYGPGDGEQTFEDTRLAGACSFLRGADGELRCLPTARARAAFSDAACTQALAGVDLLLPDCFVPPHTLAGSYAVVAADSCAPPAQVITLAPHAPGTSTVYRKTAEGCAADGAITGYAAGAPVALERFAAARIEVE
jgi:hypothetical protein